MHNDDVDSGSASPEREDAASSALVALRTEVDDLRALVLGLGVVVVLVWILGVLAEAYSFGTGCCNSAWDGSIFNLNGDGLLWIAGVAVLLVSTVALWSSRSREVRELREEWRELSTDSRPPPSVNLLERMGAWRDALRRNLEASAVCGFLLPFLIFLLAMSMNELFTGSSGLEVEAVALGVITSAAAFSLFQVVSILQSVRRARTDVADARRRLLDEFASAKGPEAVPIGRPEVRSDGPGPVGIQLSEVAGALRRREREANDALSSERRIGMLLLFGALAVMVVFLATSIELMANPSPYGYVGPFATPNLCNPSNGIVLDILVLLGVGTVAWTVVGLSWGPSSREGPVADSPDGAPSGTTIARIDQATEDLDRARATAGRGRNAFVIAAILVTAWLGFTPACYIGGSSLGVDFLGLVEALFVPSALLVVLWTAYRLERIEALQLELRRWVRALARLEQAFWDRY
jgi:hypothetical protein